MTDAALNWFDYGADISIENGDIQADNGLATSVLISLFSDARAPSPAVLPIGEDSRRGWWGDLDAEDMTGSLLWLIRREKAIPEVAAKAQQYCVEALRWLKDEEIAESYSVEATIIKPFSLQIKISIVRGTARRYSYLWKAVEDYAGMVVQNTSVQLQFIE